MRGVHLGEDSRGDLPVACCLLHVDEPTETVASTSRTVERHRVSAIATGGRAVGPRRYRSASAIARSLRQASATARESDTDLTWRGGRTLLLLLLLSAYIAGQLFAAFC